jgi:hypothetical protein
MIKVADEILQRYASLLSYEDLYNKVPVPDVPKTEELELVEHDNTKESEKGDLSPIELPDVVHETQVVEEKEPERGTAEWEAKYHTQEFLKGVKQPYRGWIRDPANKDLVENTMKKLIDENPSAYFSWDLHRRQELKSWLYPAAIALISEDPVEALMKEIYRFSELSGLNTELWKEVMNHEIIRSMTDPSSSGKVFGGKLFNKMRQLAGRIAISDPEFYSMFIEGKPITTKDFDGTAKRMLNQKK